MYRKFADEENGKAIFRAAVSLQRFFHVSIVLRFDDRDTRSSERQNDKFPAIRDLRDIWGAYIAENFLSQCICDR